MPRHKKLKVEDIIKRLREFDINPVVIDPEANADDAKHEYNVDLAPMSEAFDADCVVFAVAHNQFKSISVEQLDKMFKPCSNEHKVVIDVKSILNKDEILKKRYSYWSL